MDALETDLSPGLLPVLPFSNWFPAVRVCGSFSTRVLPPYILRRPGIYAEKVIQQSSPALDYHPGDAPDNKG